MPTTYRLPSAPTYVVWVTPVYGQQPTHPYLALIWHLGAVTGTVWDHPVLLLILQMESIGRVGIGLANIELRTWRHTVGFAAISQQHNHGDGQDCVATYVRVQDVFYSSAGSSVVAPVDLGT